MPATPYACPVDVVRCAYARRACSVTRLSPRRARHAPRSSLPAPAPRAGPPSYRAAHPPAVSQSILGAAAPAEGSAIKPATAFGGGGFSAAAGSRPLRAQGRARLARPRAARPALAVPHIPRSPRLAARTCRATAACKFVTIRLCWALRQCDASKLTVINHSFVHTVNHADDHANRCAHNDASERPRSAACGVRVTSHPFNRYCTGSKQGIRISGKLRASSRRILGPRAHSAHNARERRRVVVRALVRHRLSPCVSQPGRDARRNGLCTRHQPLDSSMAAACTFSWTPRALLVHVEQHCPPPETTNDERDRDRYLASV
jgi:hypothetical protein